MGLRRSAGFAWLLSWLLLSCSKENALHASENKQTGIGSQCSGQDDSGCGSAGVCVLGYCREGCATDAECKQGGLCVGNAVPYGCQLEDELACDDVHKCTAGLKCGIDSKCRMPCGVGVTCPRNEQECIQGTCVAKTEAGALDTWFSCTTGEVRCGGADGLTLQQCNASKPGWASAPTGVEGSCVALGGACDAEGAICATSGTACVLELCREECSADTDCENGALCIGAKPPFGCQLPQDTNCSASQPCQSPLVCSLDATCRTSCGQTADCPRSDQQCIEGTCYGSNETGASLWSCDGSKTGDRRCKGSVVQVCNIGGLGWVDGETCSSPDLCLTAAAGTGKCPFPPTLLASGPARAIAVDDTSVYWMWTDALHKMDKNGGTPTILWSGATNEPALRLDATSVYWTVDVGGSEAGIMKVGKAGGTPVKLLTGAVSAISVDGDMLYGAADTIFKLPVAGGTTITLAPATQSIYPFAFTAIAGNVFWTTFSEDTLYKVSESGGTVATLVKSSVALWGFAVVSDTVYYADSNGNIMKIADSGGTPVTLATDQDHPTTVAADATNVYWLCGASNGPVTKVSVNGGTPLPLAIGQSDTWGIALDDTYVYWTSGQGVMKASK